MILFCEGERFVVRAQRSRIKRTQSDYPYSKTIVRRALDDGVGFEKEVTVRLAGLEDGAIVAGADHDGGVGRKGAGEAGD